MSNNQNTFKEKLIDLVYEELLSNGAADGTRKILRSTLLAQMHVSVPEEVIDRVFKEHVMEGAIALVEQGFRLDDRGFPISTTFEKVLKDTLEKGQRNILQAPLTIVPAGWNHESKDLARYIKENFEAFKDSEYLIWSDNLTSVFSLDTIKKTFIIFSNDQTDETSVPFVITFHTGNPNEGINGISMESLLAVVMNRLNYYNTTEFKCAENKVAAQCCSQAIQALTVRYRKRLEDGKLGTNEI